MTTTLQPVYGTADSLVSITLTSLGAAGFRQSLAISNVVTRYLDVLVQLTVKTGASTPTDSRAVMVYAYGGVPYASGTYYPDGITGTDAALTDVIAIGGGTNAVPQHLVYVGAVETPTAATTYTGGPWAVAKGFGGWLPSIWGIVVLNATGQTLSATASDHIVRYQGVQGREV